MPGVIAPLRPSTSSVPKVRSLRLEDVPDLRLSGRRSPDSLRQALARHPGRSVWIPETLEYALIGRWRHRSEIASVDELVAVRNVEPLLRAAFARCVEHGDDLLLAIEFDTYRGRSRYERAGMEPLEEIITYEIDVSRVPPSTAKRLRPRRIDRHDAAAVDLVTRLDQAAFPWLWRNSRAEFEVYLDSPGVEVALLMGGDGPVAYFGATLFSGWGHLDRIAVAPAFQGQGFGRAALTLAIDSLRQRGARRVGLSTQRTNERSQRLYERFGFSRTPELDYQLYGAWNPATCSRAGRSV